MNSYAITLETVFPPFICRLVLSKLFFEWICSIPTGGKQLRDCGFGIKNWEAQSIKTAGLDTIQYSVESEVKFWFFGDVELQFLTRSSFKQGMVSRTYSHSKTNRGNFVSKVNWKDNAYQVNANSYKYTNKKAVSGPLSWCSSKLFFQEPTGQEIFISEVYGVTAPIRKTGPGEYTVSVEGNTNRYYYRQGKLVKIVVDNPIKNYQVRLAN